MSFVRHAYPSVDVTAPDSDETIICPGCTRLTVQIFNQPVYITFGVGLAAPLFGDPEPYAPYSGQIVRDFDAFKFRAYIPAAQLGGGLQANVKLTPVK